MPLLGDLSPDAFLRDYWQKKPLLVRGALPDFTSPLAPEELAGLALEDDVTSRLILEQGGAHPWEVRYGPFGEQDFTTLPETHWTLLVQEVDRLVPEVARLLDAFAFIPNWRIDDVMVSFAPDQGTVGPHVDSYDVFLIQGLGHRRWQIGSGPVREERYVEGLDVRLLADFEPAEEWVLEPGDLLYLPPRVAHHGVALDDCMTYSIGFRAPAYDELVAGYINHAAALMQSGALYQDPDLEPTRRPGEITADARERLRTLLRDLTQGLLEDDAAIDRWLGTYFTSPKRGHAASALDEPYDVDELRSALEAGAVLHRSAIAHFAHIAHDDGSVSLFAGGREYLLSPAMASAAPSITGPGPVTAALLDDEDAVTSLLTELVNEGVLWVADEDEDTA